VAFTATPVPPPLATPSASAPVVPLTSPSAAPPPEPAAAPATTELVEKHITIRYGDTGNSYESLFGAYLTGAKELTVEDPYNAPSEVAGTREEAAAPPAPPAVGEDGNPACHLRLLGNRSRFRSLVCGYADALKLN